jgi:hypothetical protein
MMTAPHSIPELDRKGLRDFGLVTGGIVAIVFGLFFPWMLARPWPLWPWVLFGLLGGFGLVAPLSLRPVYYVWMRFGLLLNKVTTPLILGIVFFLVISPLGLLRRLSRNDPMARTFDSKARSYRVASREKPPDQLERPF